MGLYLDKIPSVALKAQSDGKAPPKTDIFALMTFFLESISYINPKVHPIWYPNF